MAVLCATTDLQVIMWKNEIVLKTCYSAFDFQTFCSKTKSVKKFHIRHKWATLDLNPRTNHYLTLVSLVTHHIAFPEVFECIFPPRYTRYYKAVILSVSFPWFYHDKNIDSRIMHGSILPVTIPPGIPPGICNFFSLGGLFPTPGYAERDNSPPPGFLIDHKYVVLYTKCRSRYWFPYNSKTRRFGKNVNYFLELYWTNDTNIMKTWTLYLKKKTAEKTPSALAYG